MSELYTDERGKARIRGIDIGANKRFKNYDAAIHRDFIDGEPRPCSIYFQVTPASVARLRKAQDALCR
jgi:hypothetical protein